VQSECSMLLWQPVHTVTTRLQEVMIHLMSGCGECVRCCEVKVAFNTCSFKIHIMSCEYIYIYIFKKVKWSRYRPGVAQRLCRGAALLLHDRGTRRGWVVSSTPRPHFTPGKDPGPILQEAGWVPGPVWTGGKSHPHRHSILDRPARSQSLYRLS